MDSDTIKFMLDNRVRKFEINVSSAKGLCLEYVGYDDVNNYIKTIGKAKDENI